MYSEHNSIYIYIYIIYIFYIYIYKFKHISYYTDHDISAVDCHRGSPPRAWGKASLDGPKPHGGVGGPHGAGGPTPRPLGERQTFGTLWVALRCLGQLSRIFMTSGRHFPSKWAQIGSPAYRIELPRTHPANPQIPIMCHLGFCSQTLFLHTHRGLGCREFEQTPSNRYRWYLVLPDHYDHISRVVLCEVFLKRSTPVLKFFTSMSTISLVSLVMHLMVKTLCVAQVHRKGIYLTYERLHHIKHTIYEYDR